MKLQTLVDRIDEARAEKGWCHYQLARRAGYSANAWHNLRKSPRTVSVAVLVDHAGAVGITDIVLEL